MEDISHINHQQLLSHAAKLFRNRRAVCSGSLLKYSLEEKKLAIYLVQLGFSRLRISEELEIGASTVHAWVTKNRNGEFTRDYPAPRCLAVVETQAIRKTISDTLETSKEESCEVHFGSSIFIRINPSAIKMGLLLEIQKAVQ